MEQQVEAAAERIPVLEARDIHKRFPGVHALTGVSLTVYPGEVLAIVGENGAGKSTLMKILSGALQPDDGVICIDGQPVRFTDPRDALAHGIAIIYQELSLIDKLTVAENLLLGQLPGRESATWLVDWPTVWRKASALLAQVGLSLDPQVPVARLSVGQKQLVEIARALSRNARVLILDEPTSALSLQETERLFALLRDVRARGVAILYISHRLDEIFALADRITVMRDGQVVATLPARDATREQLIRLMVGRDLQAFYADLPDPEPRVRLEVRGLSRRGVLQDITLSIRAGEIVGLAGLVGAGRTELARCLFGVDPYDTGEMLVDGQPVRIRTPRDAVRLGIGFVPEDRKLQALVLILAVRQNTTLPLIPMLSRFGIFQQRRERVLAQRYVEELRIRTPSVDQRVMNLSGGNQQKVVLARWLAAQSRILILDEPTRGIDVGAKAEVHKLIADLARQGVAILLISSELPEVLAMSHRILVMREGRIVAEFPRSQATEERVLAAATGHASVMS